MVIFHSYVSLPEGNLCLGMVQGNNRQWTLKSSNEASSGLRTVFFSQSSGLFNESGLNAQTKRVELPPGFPPPCDQKLKSKVAPWYTLHRPLSSPGKTRPGFQTASRICQMHSNALICHYLFLIFPYLLLFFLICHYFTGISISLICPYLLLFSLICNCMYNCLGTFHSMGETAAALVLAG